MPTDRQLGVLTLIARFRMMTRRQVWHACFADRSETVVTRAIDRLTAQGFLASERTSKSGYQVLWCTAKGREFLVGHGIAGADLFPARGPVAAKDFRHSEAIVDVAVALITRGCAARTIVPAWALQRLCGGLAAVPDLLVVAKATVLAIEVDRGGESHRVVLAKLVKLDAWLAARSSATAGILVLTCGARRRASLAAATTRAGLRTPTTVALLTTFTDTHRESPVGETPASDSCAPDHAEPETKHCPTGGASDTT